MGTPRRSHEAKRRSGTLRPGTRQPKPRPLAPAKPRTLSRAAAAVWDSLEAELVRIGMLTVVDGDTFAAYCESVVTYRRAQRAVARLKSLTVMRPSGRRPAPEFAIAKAACADMLRLGKMFGVTPEARGQEARPPSPRTPEEQRENEAFFERPRTFDPSKLLDADPELEPRSRRRLHVVGGRPGVETLREKSSTVDAR